MDAAAEGVAGAGAAGADGANVGGGRGARGRGGRGERGRGRGGNRRNFGYGRQQGRGGDGRSRQAQEGHADAMAGYMFDVPNGSNPNQYDETSQRLRVCLAAKYPTHTHDLIEGLRNLELDMPDEVPDPTTEGAVVIAKWKNATAAYDKKVLAYEDFKGGAFHLIFGQCTTALVNKLESFEDYANAIGDGIALLIMIRTVMIGFEEHSNTVFALTDIKERWFALKIKPQQTVAEYHTEFCL